MEGDPFRTQRDVGPAVVTELSAAGFDGAEEIGRGGFGIVYRCTQVGLDRTVAVKVLTGELDEDKERFLREQRAMGRLTGHPNIVSVLQVGQTDSGYPYLVMQYHRQDSLDARIRRDGPVPLDEVLRLGVRMTGALETAHRLGIVHRDVKPANILLTDYGEPALSDFGIAHVAGGFKTATGVFTGSPAFTAPEILSGEPPTTASDIYGLGATLFCALTGHAAFERRSGEQVVAQFLRIATESAPDLRERGIPDDVAAVVEKAMSREPQDRPSALAFGEQLQQVQSRRALPVDEMALRAEADTQEPARRPAASSGFRRATGDLPLELTSFVGRSADLSEVKKLLSEFRLVTLAGIGGVGKTRLALRAAAESVADFPDGVWLVELGELRDTSSLVDLVAAAVGLRDQSARPLLEVLVEFLSSRKLLLVLDNCEQLVDAVAKLAEKLLRACPELRILTTSRESLSIGGESVWRLSPLACPNIDAEPSLRLLPNYDAVALFAERAAAAVAGFELSDDNKVTVARICARLDGLPLAIELAAARLRAMSPGQILQRLAARYTLLSRGSRGAPTRQQALEWSIDWSYDLCTPAEQQLWARLSVFAGSFELEAVEDICGGDLRLDDLLDLLTSLVDKSILIRAESKGVVRFRLLDTLRDYGREKIRQSAEHLELRQRHRQWYHQLALDAVAGWFSSRQIDWLDRLERELPNLREALEFALSEAGETGLGLAAALYPLWFSRGMLSEGRRWLDRTLAHTPSEPTVERATALYGAAMSAGLQGDLPAATARVAEGRVLVQQTADPIAHAMVALGDGFTALVGGDLDHACTCLDDALGVQGHPAAQAGALLMLGWAHELRGDVHEAFLCHGKALALSESHGESVYRTYALWSIGVAEWREGDRGRAAQLLKQGLELAQLANDPRMAASCLEALAWIAGEMHDPRVAVVMMGAAEALGHAVGSATVAFPNLLVYHEQCERRAREELGVRGFEAARQDGASLSFDEAVAYALDGLTSLTRSAMPETSASIGGNQYS